MGRGNHWVLRDLRTFDLGAGSFGSSNLMGIIMLSGAALCYGADDEEICQ